MSIKDDYSGIRGFCYPAAIRFPVEKIKRELEWAQRLQLNSTRIWLHYKNWLDDPNKFLDNLVTFVRTAGDFGITTMPVLFRVCL